MNCLRIIREVQKQGQYVAQQGGKLLVSNPEALPTELRGQLRQAKGSIVELLRSIDTALRHHHLGPWRAADNSLNEVEFECGEEEHQTLAWWVLRWQRTEARDWCMRKAGHYFLLHPNTDHRRAESAAVIDFMESHCGLLPQYPGDRAVLVEAIAQKIRDLADCLPTPILAA